MKTFEPYILDLTNNNKVVAIPLNQPNVTGLFYVLWSELTDTEKFTINEDFSWVSPVTKGVQNGMFNSFYVSNTNILNQEWQNATPITSKALKNKPSDIQDLDTWLGRRFKYESEGDDYEIKEIIGFGTKQIYNKTYVKPYILNVTKMVEAIEDFKAKNPDMIAFFGNVTTMNDLLKNVISEAGFFLNDVPSNIVWLNKKKYNPLLLQVQQSAIKKISVKAGEVVPSLDLSTTNNENKITYDWQKVQDGLMINNKPLETIKAGVPYDVNDTNAKGLKTIVIPPVDEYNVYDNFLSLFSGAFEGNSSGERTILFWYDQQNTFGQKIVIGCRERFYAYWLKQQRYNEEIIRLILSGSIDYTNIDELIKNLQAEARIQFFAMNELTHNYWGGTREFNYPTRKLNDEKSFVDVSDIASTICLYNKMLLNNDREFCTGDVLKFKNKQYCVITKIVNNDNTGNTDYDMFFLLLVDGFLDGNYSYKKFTETQKEKAVLVASRQQLRSFKMVSLDYYARQKTELQKRWEHKKSLFGNMQTDEETNVINLQGISPLVEKELNRIDWVKLAEIEKSKPEVGDLVKKFLQVISKKYNDTEVVNSKNKFLLSNIRPLFVANYLSSNKFDGLEYPISGSNQIDQQIFGKSIKDQLNDNDKVAFDNTWLKIIPYIEAIGNIAQENSSINIHTLNSLLHNLFVSWKQSGIMQWQNILKDKFNYINPFTHAGSTTLYPTKRGGYNDAILSFVFQVTDTSLAPFFIRVEIGFNRLAVCGIPFASDYDEFERAIDFVIEQSQGNLIANCMYAIPYYMGKMLAVFESTLKEATLLVKNPTDKIYNTQRIFPLMLQKTLANYFDYGLVADSFESIYHIASYQIQPSVNYTAMSGFMADYFSSLYSNWANYNSIPCLFIWDVDDRESLLNMIKQSYRRNLVEGYDTGFYNVVYNDAIDVNNSETQNVFKKLKFYRNTVDTAITTISINEVAEDVRKIYDMYWSDAKIILEQYWQSSLMDVAQQPTEKQPVEVVDVEVEKPLTLSEQPESQPVERKRGRPRKGEEKPKVEEKPKGKRGRPKKEQTTEVAAEIDIPESDDDLAALLEGI